jgi:hypothetical protein
MAHHNQRDNNCNGCIFHNDTRLAKRSEKSGTGKEKKNIKCHID